MSCSPFSCVAWFQFPTGWNSTLSRIAFSTSFRVSIPNGMEFYRSRREKLCRLRCVSIPNGMEFYIYRFKFALAENKFQFPTGWNSTLRSANIQKYNWRFNSQRDGILRWNHSLKSKIEQRFNSQRDGILRVSDYIYLDGSRGFNSQRDGILPEIKLFYTAGQEFQFPTGWNSTRERRRKSCKKT